MASRRKRALVQWGIALGLGAAMPSPGAEAIGTAPLPAGQLADKPGIVVLQAVPGPSTVDSGYSLQVVDMPPPPQLPPPTEPVERPAPTCPIEVRAIIAGAEVGDRFAVVVSGDDAESSIVRRGDTVRTATGWFNVTAIRPHSIRLRHGESAVRCDLRP